jgi:hypothetical protein
MRHTSSPYRHSLLIYPLALMSILGVGCSSGSDNETRREAQEETTKTAVFIGSLEQAMSENLIQVGGQGLGTYKQIELYLENTSDREVQIEVEAGSHFRNPVSSSQNLITLRSEKITLKKGSQERITLPAACTNASLRVPGREGDWKWEQAPKDLDKALRFYGKHEQKIGEFLAKKNPEKLSNPEQRQAFLQVAIWTYLGDNPEDIIGLLAQEVFHNDIQRARDFFDSVREDATRIAEMLRNRDDEAIKSWLRAATEELLLRGKDKIENAADNLRGRLNQLRSN